MPLLIQLGFWAKPVRELRSRVIADEDYTGQVGIRREREISRYVEDQLSWVIGEGIDGAIVGRDDGHVGGDGAVIGIQG